MVGAQSGSTSPSLPPKRRPDAVHATGPRSSPGSGWVAFGPVPQSPIPSSHLRVVHGRSSEFDS